MAKKNIASEIVQIQITQDTTQRIQFINQQNKWDFEQGVRRILGAGLGFLEMESFDKSEPPTDEKAALIRRVIEGESIIASLQYKLFEEETANKNWKLSSGAIEVENNGLRQAAFRHLQRVDELTLSNSRLTKENEELKEQIKDLTAGREQSRRSTIFRLLENILHGGKKS